MNIEIRSHKLKIGGELHDSFFEVLADTPPVVWARVSTQGPVFCCLGQGTDQAQEKLLANIIRRSAGAGSAGSLSVCAFDERGDTIDSPVYDRERFSGHCAGVMIECGDLAATITKRSVAERLNPIVKELADGGDHSASCIAVRETWNRDWAWGHIFREVLQARLSDACIDELGNYVGNEMRQRLHLST